MDAAGNLRGVRSSSNMSKHVVIASHLDTVPNAGAFDGILGVVMGIAVAQELRNTQLPFALEIIAFSEEEGVRFGVPFIGSRAFVGTLDDALLAHTDNSGITVRNAMQDYGLDDTTLAEAKHTDVSAYLEFHIEQGPVLDSEGLPLGVVESIAGQSRYTIGFHGHANHAGTTPMHLRHDAMSAAAEWIVEVERYAKATPGLVATVGSVLTFPGAGNVIAGKVIATLDVRSALDSIRKDASEHLHHFAETCAGARGVHVTSTLRMQQDAVPMDRTLLRVLEDAVDSTGSLVRRMVSGAGHDAMIVAPHMPAAMLFLRSLGGLSHHPDEAVVTGDVQLGLDAGIAFVTALAEREANQ
jgi:allantoate deiminase